MKTQHDEESEDEKKKTHCLPLFYTQHMQSQRLDPTSS